MSEEKKLKLGGWVRAARIAARFLSGFLFPVRYHGKENIENATGPMVVLSNHRDLLDPMLIGAVMRGADIYWLGKKEIGKSKLLGYVVKKLHMIMVDRHNTDMAAMRQCIAAVREGHILGIFPEGTRTLGQPLAHMESGASLIAMRCKAPILPVYIDKPCRLFRKNDIYFGQAFEPDDLYAQGTDSQTIALLQERVKTAILSLKTADLIEK